MAHILSAGIDPALLQTRKLMLEQAGHTVATATSESDVRDACSRMNVDVVVIGQTVVPQEKRRILEIVREACGSTKVLELFHPHRGQTLRNADQWMEVPAEIPVDFVKVVTDLASRRAKSGA